MERFTASNGWRVVVDDEDVTATGPDLAEPVDGAATALREFFQHERDQELGRWRWPENPDYVVYQNPDGQAAVLHEPSGDTVYRYRGEDAELRAMRAANGDDVMPATEAAAAYFAAHPEPKPWHDAKPGEVWVLKRRGEERAHGVVERLVHSNTFVDPQARRPSFPVNDAGIEFARRIWPESSDE